MHGGNLSGRFGLMSFEDASVKDRTHNFSVTENLHLNHSLLCHKILKPEQNSFTSRVRRSHHLTNGEGDRDQMSPHYKDGVRQAPSI